MAVQFPNFLSVPAQRPDFSGLSDIFQNYYGGKALKQNDIINQSKVKEAPLDLLFKQIQAEFARPNAETALAGAKLGNQGKSLSNRKEQMAIQTLQRELGQQAKFDAAMKEAQRAASGGSGQGTGIGGGMGGSGTSMIMPTAMQAPTGVDAVRQQQNGTALQKGLMEVMQHQAMKNQESPTQAPLLDQHPEEEAQTAQTAQNAMPTQPKSQMQEITAGNPAEYFVDKLWEENPDMRALIKKRGYRDKEEKPEYDKKTGVTRITTRWPSGRTTVKTIQPVFDESDLEKGIPLTPQVLNKVVNQVRGSDAVMPYIDKIIEMGENGELPHSSLYWSDASANFESTVDEALEGYMSSTGATNTDLSTKKMESILGRHFNESTSNYIKRLKRKKEELAKAREQNVKMITKGLKKNPNMAYGSGNEKSYSSDQWEVTNEQ